MLQEKTEKFQSLATHLLPMLFCHARRCKVEVFDDYAQLIYTLRNEIEITDITMIFENHPDTELCYLTQPCEEAGSVSTCCAFSRPCGHDMYKMNAITSKQGMVDTVTVTVYDDLEYMLYDIRYDLESHADHCPMEYRIDIMKLLSLFSV